MRIQTTTPSPLPLKKLRWEYFVDLIGKAHRTLAEFDDLITNIKHKEAAFSLLAQNEALATSLKGIPSYQSALLKIAKTSRKTPLSPVFLCKIHKIIRQKSLSNPVEIGQLRTKQNWIGPEGCTIEEAYFYPPCAKLVQKYMNQLTKYLHYKEKDPLVQLAIYFAQLLIIHPFMDGNGRLGRALIPLFLYQKKLTSAPLFYLSPFFKRHRLQYFEKLFAITTEEKWEEWIRFFLNGVIEEGRKNIKILSTFR